MPDAAIFGYSGPISRISATIIYELYVEKNQVFHKIQELTIPEVGFYMSIYCSFYIVY